MNTVSFESRLLSDGHLYCPKEFAQKDNVRFKVIVLFEEQEMSEQDIELSAITDNSTDFLTEEELNYYLMLENLE
ncbi:MAG: hypothetical protein R2941_05570 [Desulfobacterales bacterium]